MISILNKFLIRFSNEDEIVISNTDIRSSSMNDFLNHFDPNKETKIIIHGWWANIRESSIWSIVNAYRLTSDFNVIGKIYFLNKSIFCYLLNSFVLKLSIGKS